MTVQHVCCAGLDVHQKTMVVCVRQQRETDVTYTEQTFGTTTRELCALGDWLIAQGCTHAVLEATGVYWKPVWYVLETRLTLLLAYAAAVRQLKGRKTDASDAHWLADLLAHGLIQPSYVPPPAIRELRDLTRTRHQLVHEVAQHTQRIQKVLVDASIKLATVVTDVLGVSGRAVMRGLIAGERNPARLADAVDPRVRAGRAALEAAFDGRCTPHHAFLLQLHLDQIEALERTIARLEARIAEQVAPFRATLERLMTVPGIKETVARVILAEVGPEVSRFATAGHLVSWAHLLSSRRECGQTPLHADSAGAHLAQDDAHSGGLGGREAPRHVSACPIRPAARPPRCQEGDRRRRLFDARRPVSHAATRGPLSGSWRRLFHPSRSRTPSALPRAPAPGARLRR
jgi:transposase